MSDFHSGLRSPPPHNWSNASLLTFSIEVFWANLTVESAFLVRAYAEFCRSKDDDVQFEKAIPEVTRHAYHIQKYSNIMQEADEEDRPEAEFIVTQLLMIAKLLDYADENGRRKMFNLLRKAIIG
jgi:condensin complex subunit 3